MPKKVSKSYHKNVNAKDIRIWKKWQKRTKVLAVALLVVALGAGGYWAYKSFAAEASFAYTVGNGVLHPGTGATILADTGAGKTKSGQSVIVLPSGGSNALVSNPTQGQATEVHIPKGQRYQLCVDEKGSVLGNIDANTIKTADLSNYSSSSQDNRYFGVIGGQFGYGTGNLSSTSPLSNGYTEYCNQPATAKTDLYGPITVSFGQNHTSDYRSGIGTTEGTHPDTVYLSAVIVKFVN